MALLMRRSRPHVAELSAGIERMPKNAVNASAARMAMWSVDVIAFIAVMV